MDDPVGGTVPYLLFEERTNVLSRFKFLNWCDSLDVTHHLVVPKRHLDPRNLVVPPQVKVLASTVVIVRRDNLSANFHSKMRIYFFYVLTVDGMDSTSPRNKQLHDGRRN